MPVSFLNKLLNSARRPASAESLWGRPPITAAESWAHGRHPHHQAGGAIPNCGSFEVRYSDGRPSQYFYWEDLPGRRLRPDLVTSDVALEQSKAFARAERDQWLSRKSSSGVLGVALIDASAKQR
jgi:hypothetical protein